MAEVAVAYVSLVPTARNFRQNTVRALTPHVTRAGTQLGGMFSSSFNRSTTTALTRSTAGASTAFKAFATTAATAAAGATAAMAGLTAGAVVAGLKTAASLQSAQIGFETMLGSAVKASKFLTNVRAFAVRTPFEVEGLIGNARALLGVGVAAKDVLPTLRSLGDATSALGLNQDQFNGVLRAYTQIASKGKVQAEELLQISENGIPATQLFAKALGLTVPQLQKLTAEGKLTADVALPALLSQLNKDYGGSMAKQFNTLSGVLSNFKESVKLGLSDAVQPLVPILQKVIPRATAATGAGLKVAGRAIGDFVAGFQGANIFKDGRVSFFEQLGSGAQKAAASLRGMFTAVMPALRSFGNFLVNKIAPIVVSYYRQLFPALKKSFQQIGQTISENQNTFRALGQIFTRLILPALSQVGIFVAKSLGPIFKTFVNVLRNFVIPLLITFADAVLGVLDVIISGAAHAFGWLPVIGDKLKAANRSFDKFAVGVNNSLRNIERLVQVDVVVRVRTTTADITGGFNGENLTPQQAAAQQRQRVIDAATKSTRDAARKAKDAATSAFGAVGKGAGTALADGLASTADGIGKTAKDTVNKAADAARQALQDAQSSLKDYARSIRDSIRDFGSLTGLSSTGAAATPASLTRFLTNQLASIKAFQSNLRALAKRGLPDRLLAQIADAGVEQGGPIAAALVRSSKSQFSGIVDIEREIARRSSNVGGLVAQRVKGDEVAAARTNIEELNVTINNPKAERASESTPKAVRRSLIRAGA